MQLEDLERFEVTPWGAYGGTAVVRVDCTRCGWDWWSDSDEPTSLAELVQRAGEHAEVCQ